MRHKPILMALAIFAVTGIVHLSQSLAEAWQGNVIMPLSGMMKAAAMNDDRQHAVDCGWSEQESLIHKVGADSYSSGYSGMSGADMKSGTMSSQQGSVAGDQYRITGEYKSGSSGNDSRYGANPSDNYFQKESSRSSGGPYGGSVYGTGPTMPSADPMIKGLNREPSMR